MCIFKAYELNWDLLPHARRISIKMAKAVQNKKS
jgi:hypothetical protein